MRTYTRTSRARGTRAAIELKQPGCRRFTIGDVGVELRSDRPSVLEEIEQLYPCDERHGHPRDGWIRLSVRKGKRTLRGSRRYDVCDADGVLSGDHHPDELLPYVEWAINGRLIATCAQYMQIHAASLSYRGVGVVFSGASGAGKSTLAAALVSRGWKYLCDEFALVDPKTLLLQPFPKALCVKAGSFELIRQLGLRLSRERPYVRTFKGRVGYVSPREISASIAHASCPVGAVVFPKYTGHRTPSIRSLPRGRAAIGLAAQCLNRPDFADGGLETLHRLVENANCFALEIGDLDDTCALIESVL